MDQKQQNTKAHLVLGSLIEMEDTEKSHSQNIESKLCNYYSC